jgi:hypothetical protein
MGVDMEKTYAWVNKTSYMVENIIAWDGVSPLAPPDNYEVAEIPEDLQGTWSSPGIGWSYINGQFVEPPAPERPSDQPRTTGSQTL